MTAGGGSGGGVEREREREERKRQREREAARTREKAVTEADVHTQLVKWPLLLLPGAWIRGTHVRLGRRRVDDTEALNEKTIKPYATAIKACRRLRRRGRSPSDVC